MQKIEEQVEAVEGVKEVRATAAEGIASVTVELQRGTSVSRALDDIKSEVDQITTFPAEAEEPEVRELTNRQSVMRIALYGDTSERALKELAYRAEDELSALEEVSYVETSGIRLYEISIEVSQAAQQAYDLTLPEVARRVAQGSLDLPRRLHRHARAGGPRPHARPELHPAGLRERRPPQPAGWDHAHRRRHRRGRRRVRGQRPHHPLQR